MLNAGLVCFPRSMKRCVDYTYLKEPGSLLFRCKHSDSTAVPQYASSLLVLPVHTSPTGSTCAPPLHTPGVGLTQTYRRSPAIAHGLRGGMDRHIPSTPRTVLQTTCSAKLMPVVLNGTTQVFRTQRCTPAREAHTRVFRTQFVWLACLRLCPDPTYHAPAYVPRGSERARLTSSAYSTHSTGDTWTSSRTTCGRKLLAATVHNQCVASTSTSSSSGVVLILYPSRGLKCVAAVVAWQCCNSNRLALVLASTHPTSTATSGRMHDVWNNAMARHRHQSFETEIALGNIAGASMHVCQSHATPGESSKPSGCHTLPTCSHDCTVLAHEQTRPQSTGSCIPFYTTRAPCGVPEPAGASAIVLVPWRKVRLRYSHDDPYGDAPVHGNMRILYSYCTAHDDPHVQYCTSVLAIPYC